MYSACISEVFREAFPAGRELLLEPNTYLEGQGDFVGRFITPITHIVTPVIPIIKLVTKPP